MLYRLVGTKTYKDGNSFSEVQILDRDFESLTDLNSFLDLYIGNEIEAPLVNHYKFMKLKQYRNRWQIVGCRGMNPPDDYEYKEWDWDRHLENEKRLEQSIKYHDHTNGKINDPSWRGPNGNWSLD